jgi:hypothetical protein
LVVREAGVRGFVMPAREEEDESEFKLEKRNAQQLCPIRGETEEEEEEEWTSEAIKRTDGRTDE